MARTKKAVAKVVKEEAPKLYSFSVKICDQVLSTKTDELLETILSIKPKMLKGKVLFIISNGKKTIEKTMMPFQARKLFSNKMTAEFFTKNIMLSLK